MSLLSSYDMMGTPVPQPVAPEPADLGAGRAQSVTLRRMGKRPLAFEGVELCMAMSFVPGSPFWYEVNVFRTTEGGFVAAVKMFFSAENERDICRAWSCESFAQVMEVLEGYDAANDIRIDLPADETALALPELAAHALMLRARAEEARRQFASLVGEILFDLEAA